MEGTASRDQVGLPHDRTISKRMGRRSSIFDADMFALPAHGLAQQNAWDNPGPPCKTMRGVLELPRRLKDL